MNLYGFLLIWQHMTVSKKVLDIKTGNTDIHLQCTISMLTLILLEPKVISLSHQYRAKTPFNLRSPTRLYTFDDIPKMILDSSRNGRWIKIHLKN